LTIEVVRLVEFDLSRRRRQEFKVELERREITVNSNYANVQRTKIALPFSSRQQQHCGGGGGDHQLLGCGPAAAAAAAASRPSWQYNGGSSVYGRVLWYIVCVWICRELTDCWNVSKSG